MKTKIADSGLDLCYFSEDSSGKWHDSKNVGKSFEPMNITIGFNVDNVVYIYIQKGNYYSSEPKCASSVFLQNILSKTWKTWHRYIDGKDIKVSMWVSVNKYRSQWYR